MSYNGVRNKSGISERRAHFGSSAASDIPKSINIEDFGAGCFFGAHSGVPENGYALSLNMQPCGTSLETRKEHSAKKITEALRRVALNDIIFGIDESELYTIGSASVKKGGAGFLIECDFSGAGSAEYRAPGVYVMKAIEAGKYLFRLYLGGGVCPKIKIYESTERVYYEGLPDVLAMSGVRYVQIPFTALGKLVRIDLTYEKSGAETQTHEIARPVLIDISSATALGVSEGLARSTHFDGEYAVLESTVSVPDGENEAECFAGGRYIFKRGVGLYSVEAKSGRCYLEYPLMPSCACTIYRLGEGFRAVCENGDIVTTSDSSPGAGTLKSEIYTPVHYCLYNPNGEMTHKKIEEFNALNEYFYVKLSLGGAEKGYLPENLFVDGGFCEAYDPETMELLPKGDVTLEAYSHGGGALTEDSYCYGILVKLRFRSDSEEGKFVRKCRNMLFSPEGSEVFPENESGEQNAVLYKGKELLVLPLRADMYAAEKDMGLAENAEKITAVLKYSENFLVFSPNYIRKMVVTNGEESGFDVIMQNFRYENGCDMPGSAVCADDKIIYANSRTGVFCIDRFGFTERDMARHVSGNIELGENGFFACDEAELAAAQAAVCGGKYFLRVGDYFYVWDFAHASPGGTEKASEERKLRWFMYSGIPVRKILGADGGALYFLTDGGDFANLERGTDISSGAESYFRSASYSLARFGEASVWRLLLSLSSNEPCTVRLYFDGEEGNSKYTLTPEAGESTLCIVRPEARGCRSFAFSLHSFGAVRLDGIKIEYLPK